MPRSNQMRAELESAQDEGWELKIERDEWALLERPSWGSKRVHVVLFFTTAGIGNAIYAYLRQWGYPPGKFVGDPPGWKKRVLGRATQGWLAKRIV